MLADTIRNLAELPLHHQARCISEFAYLNSYATVEAAEGRPQQLLSGRKGQKLGKLGFDRDLTEGIVEQERPDDLARYKKRSYSF
jgi:hypothetical protein